MQVVKAALFFSLNSYIVLRAIRVSKYEQHCVSQRRYINVYDCCRGKFALFIAEKSVDGSNQTVGNSLIMQYSF